MDATAKCKDELRRRMKDLRSGIAPEKRAEIDGAICANVCNLEEFQKADVVYAYLAFGAEVETRGIIERSWAAGKAVALPRCVGPRQMRWFKVEDLDNLETSKLGVDEPRIDAANEVPAVAHARALALVPALAYDAQGYRLGYGGGFYDAFLEGFKGVSVGLCRSAQRVDDLKGLGAIGQFDLPVDMVVTEAAE